MWYVDVYCSICGRHLGNEPDHEAEDRRNRGESGPTCADDGRFNSCLDGTLAS